jgi:WD40 repeat protein
LFDSKHTSTSTIPAQFLLFPPHQKPVRSAPVDKPDFLRQKVTHSLYFHTLFMSAPFKSTPLVAPGHTRPITHLSFSPIQEDGTFLLISSCKDGNPMLREWTGDWIGTFLGHKGAVWCTKLSLDASRAASGSADFTAYELALSYTPSLLTILV